jgi:ribosomal protein S18 acetylase RimI-like enzyme
MAALEALFAWYQALDASDTLDAPGILALRQRTPHGAAMLIVRPNRDPHVRSNLDTTLAFLAEYVQHDLVCWPMMPSTERKRTALSALLLAHGFEPNWQSNWMWLDLQVAEVAVEAPVELRIVVVQQESDIPDVPVAHLPYYSVGDARRVVRAGNRTGGQIQQVLGLVDGQVVAQSVVHITTGASGIASIRNVGVVPQMRRRGYGAVLTQAALRLGRAAGCQIAMLSATDEGQALYETLGFQQLERHPTWLLRRATLSNMLALDKLIAEDPVRGQQLQAEQELVRAMAEAAGRGKLTQLRRLIAAAPNLIDTALHSGLTPLRVAAELQQVQAVELLFQHGAVLDIPTSWSLGWHTRAAQLLQANPALANMLHGPQQISALHIAAWQNDLALATLILSANPDLSIKDNTFHATALGWAQHFGHEEIVRMIEQHVSM